MKKLILAGLTIALMFIIGCGGAALLQAPKITGVVADSNSVTLTWEADTTIENDTDFQGYNVYVSTDSTELLVSDGENLNKFNATVITGNTYTVTGLSKDTVYYFQVRTVNTDDKVGDYNTDVPYVQMSPRPGYVIGQLTMEISSADSNETGCALRFETGEVLDEVNGEFPNADVFADKVDADSAQLVTASARTNGRSTLIAKLDTTVYSYDNWDFSGYTFGNDDRQVIRINDLLLCKTEEGNYVKVLIQDVDLTNNTVSLKFAYQNLADYPYLSP